MRPIHLFCGTSGYSYKEWKGPFYPEDLPAAGMLGFYGERFRSVEINNTFYRMPKESVLGRWREEVPDEFRFVLKASRRITHQHRLKDAGDSVDYLLKVSAALGEKLGPFLFQLPPFLKKDIPRLVDFLALLPDDCRAAFEFRNATWFDDETFAALRDRGAALCIADNGKDDDPPLVATSDWGYLRLRRSDYGADDLADWARRIREQEWGDVFVFFKHEDEGAGPRLARDFEAAFEAGPRG